MIPQALAEPARNHTLHFRLFITSWYRVTVRPQQIGLRASPRGSAKVRVPHDSDLDQVLALMLEAAGRPPRILATPAPTALVMAFVETAIELELRVWI